jgi:hypothetical protein
VDPPKGTAPYLIRRAREPNLAQENPVARDEDALLDAHGGDSTTRLAVVDPSTAGCLSGPVGSDPVADFLRLAAIPLENVSGVEEFLRRQESDSSNTLAVLERPNQPVALLKIHAGEATLFSFLPSQDGRSLVHETFIGKIYDATITQVHAVENLADASAPKPERVEIAGSRLGGTINLTYYTAEERAALMDSLREIVPR